MKVLIVLSALAALAAAKYVENPEVNTAFDYMRRFGIPEAERIRQAEEEYLQSRIAGGAPANLGQFPYQAGLISDISGTTNRGVCGGSLLSANRVVTAAHCWFDGRSQAWRVEVVLGSVTLFTGGTRIFSENVVMHAQWNPNTIRNDIAMIYLPRTVAFSNTISPIALPSGAELNQDFAGETGLASGFGLTGDNVNISQNQFLSGVALEIITNAVCARSFPFNVVNSNICTSGAGGKSTCRGDSGGPLVVSSNNKQILVGITSFGSAMGCTRGFPAAFVRVTSFIDFINNNL